MSSTRFGFCGLVLCLCLVSLNVASVTCYYENPEEELVQPNRIDEVSSNFECHNEGYFADVTYGCQFYHVCENANSPYDKPSFVKHTFSCVNGTVFNQMSFTCTRYQDSIPCESSPNYFYLNKRNGDPKAYFLTDDDIVKPSGASLKHSFVSSSLPAAFSTLSNKATFKSSSSYVTNSPVASSPRPVALLAKPPIREPLENPESYGQLDQDYESNSLSHDNSYSHKASAPYELSAKYHSAIKPGVRYSKASYESAKKLPDHQTPHSRYTVDIRPETSLLPRAEMKGASGPKMAQYHSAITPSKVTSSKLDQLLANYEPINQDEKASLGYHRASGDFSQGSSPITIKKAPFTPAAFSKMYMENQKAAKYSHSAVSANVQAAEPSDYAQNTNSESYFPRQKLVESSQAKMHSHYTTARDLAVSKEAPLSKYEVAEAPPEHRLLKSNQYVVPASVRMLESVNLKEGPHLKQDSHQTEPVKMSFVSKQQANGGGSADFSNLRVVKQVKGKSLLIDPSLENDPARDNIIAQVLEMLNKYN